MMNRNLVTYERGSMRESRYLDCDDCMEGLQIMRGEEDKRVNFGREREDGLGLPCLPATELSGTASSNVFLLFASHSSLFFLSHLCHSPCFYSLLWSCSDSFKPFLALCLFFC
ncbi:hypothetical protein Droror1_Dr00017173 [Drosera rotundifolia]